MAEQGGKEQEDQRGAAMEDAVGHKPMICIKINVELPRCPIRELYFDFSQYEYRRPRAPHEYHMRPYYTSRGFVF